jgi:hypothetical protein
MVGVFDLPHPEIWAEDTEYYPGRGLGNGGVEGDPITPLCRVAIELCSTMARRTGTFLPLSPRRIDVQLFTSRRIWLPSAERLE